MILGSPEDNISFGNFALRVGIGVFTGLQLATVSKLLDSEHAALFPEFRALFTLTQTRLIRSPILQASFISLLMSLKDKKEVLKSTDERILLSTKYKVTLSLSNFSLSFVGPLKCSRISLALSIILLMLKCRVEN